MFVFNDKSTCNGKFLRLKMIVFSILMFFSSCDLETTDHDSKPDHNSKIEQYYISQLDTLNNSKSTGLPGGGSLENGKIIPYFGDNFQYFSESSYLRGRAFVHHNVKALVLESYKDLLVKFPNEKFRIMECSEKCGGKISGHRTHQNGLSIDFMSPLKRNNTSYYALDDIGAAHYQLVFNDNGELVDDKTVVIDFEKLGQHILALHEKARKHHLKIKKIILKKELKDDLYKTVSGKKIKKEKIYITMNLPEKINDSHDDHYHIDFEPIK